MRRSVLAVLAAGLLLAGLALALLRQGGLHTDHPNVLIIVWDTVRADHLSLYGYDRPTTPKLVKRARSGLVFERAISPAIWTPPSHASMFTGYSPPHHGVKATYKWLDGHHVTLAEWLGEQGYETYAFSANPYLSTDTNLVQGFGQVDNTFQGDWKKAARKVTRAKLIDEDASTDISPRWKPANGQRGSGSTHPYKDGGPVAHEAFVKWLEARAEPERPWLAYLNMMEAHIPRIPSIESRKALQSDAEIVTALVTDVAQVNLLAYTFGQRSYSEEQLTAIRGTYDAALRDLDTITHTLLSDLEARGLLDDTIVVLTSDHGENLGEHGMFGHKFGVWDTLVHVPLVIWYPEHLEPGRVPFPVTNLDLFHTLLTLAGVTPPDTGFEGRGDLIAQTRALPVFSFLMETTPVSINRMSKLYNLGDLSRWFATYRSVEDSGWKLIEVSDGDRQLYQVNADPGELRDVIDEHADEAARLQSLLDAHIASITPYDPALRTELDQSPEIAPSTQGMLEQLGYLDGGGGPNDDE